MNGPLRRVVVDAIVAFESSVRDYQRAETAWLNDPEVDGDDYVHPLRVELERAGTVKKAAEAVLEAAQEALFSSDEERLYALLAVTTRGRMEDTCRARSPLDALRYARQIATSWAHRAVERRVVVEVRGEDGSRDTIEIVLAEGE